MFQLKMFQLIGSGLAESCPDEVLEAILTPQSHGADQENGPTSLPNH